jgi:hypothetical protein
VAIPTDDDFEERKSVGEMNVSIYGEPGQAGRVAESRRPSPREELARYFREEKERKKEKSSFDTSKLMSFFSSKKSSEYKAPKEYTSIDSSSQSEYFESKFQLHS